MGKAVSVDTWERLHRLYTTDRSKYEEALKVGLPLMTDGATPDSLWASVFTSVEADGSKL
jgi:hypothetical protein